MQGRAATTPTKIPTFPVAGNGIPGFNTSIYKDSFKKDKKEQKAKFQKGFNTVSKRNRIKIPVHFETKLKQSRKHKKVIT